MPDSDRVSQLKNQGVDLLRRYLATHSTELLRELAPVIVDLRGSFTLNNGHADWSGRTPGYRQAIADVYARAEIPDDELSAVQAAIRYHSGNLLRERTSGDELAAVGLKRTSPRERVTTARQALRAQRDETARPQDIARITAYAQSLLDFADTTELASVPRERLVASRIALEHIRARALVLLGEVSDVLANGR